LDYYKASDPDSRAAFDKAAVVEFGKAQLQPRKDERVNDALDAGRNKFLTERA
jgi:hypothetical protein